MTEPTTKKLSRSAAILLAAVVVCLTYTSVSRAAVTVGTVPNMTRLSIALPANGFSGAISLPSANVPLVITGTTTTVGYRGTGFVHLTYASAAPAVYSFSGVNASGGGSGIAQGFTGLPGFDIVDMGYGNSVELQTGPVAGTVRLQNNTGVVLATVLQIIW
jgi:hypothetical protein